jgi:RNA polymerase sigma-70 factor (ECF subfamily)
MDNDQPINATVSHVSISAYENAFKSHFKALHSYAYSIVKDDIMAEEMVQNVFFKLWKNREGIDIHQSLIAYLYRSVYYESLNHLRHEKTKAEYRSHAARNTSNAESASEKVKLNELRSHLEAAIKKLPEQCRTIFQMSRFEELKYLEIAAKLGISPKTVENQMGKALRILRTELTDFLPIIILLLMNL